MSARVSSGTAGLAVLSVSCVLVLSILLNVKDIGRFSGENILGGADSFWFARLARDVQGKTYGPTDCLSNVPDCIENPDSPPLISLLPVYLSKATGLRMDLFFILLPPLLSTLFVFPFYFWLKDFSNIHVFLGGSILGVFNTVYFIRTGLGKFDTDFLILFFVFSILLFIARAFQAEPASKKSYIYILMAGLTFRVFMHWYDMPVFALFFTFSLVSGFLIFRTSKKHVLVKTLLFVLFLGPGTLMDGLNLKAYVTAIFFKQHDSLLPFSIASSISELQPLGLDKARTFITGNPVSLVLGGLGLVLFSVRHWRQMIIASPILLLGLTSFRAGDRFLMYLAPFIGMGIGHVARLAMEFIGRHHAPLATTRRLEVYTLVLVIVLSFPPERLYADEVRPLLPQKLYANLKNLRTMTEDNAYIWSWWDYGNAISYLSGRGTFIDNHTNFNTLKVYAVAHSLMLNDEEKSRNLIAFMTNNRQQDYAGTGETLSNVLKKAYAYQRGTDRPVYVLLDQRMMRVSSLHELGRMGTDSSSMPAPSVEKNVICSPSEISLTLSEDPSAASAVTKFNCSFFTVDLAKKEVFFKDGSKGESFHEIVLTDRSSGRKETLSRGSQTSNKVIELVRFGDKLFAYVIGRSFQDTMLNRMYILRDEFQHFKLVRDDFPFTMVYKVEEKG